MRVLEESVLNNGILNSVIVRPNDEDGYEKIFEHRRLFAVKAVGLARKYFKELNFTDAMRENVMT